MTTFKEILSDISDASQFSDRESSKSILLNIVSTMSDRASTEIKFLFQKWFNIYTKRAMSSTFFIPST
jgi:hypothetical protein